MIYNNGEPNGLNPPPKEWSPFTRGREKWFGSLFLLRL